MNTKIFVGIGVIIVAIIVAVFVIEPSEDTTTTSVSALVAQTKEAGGVTIIATPLDISSTASVWQFKVVLDTHSGDLNQDMAAIGVIISDDGRQAKPLRWVEGSLPAGKQAPGGHHREGVFEFQPMTPRPRSIELRLSGFGGAGATTFRWDL